jgi:membrane-associated phospholipid phosphatase
MVLISLVLVYEKSNIHIFINQYHHPAADFFFKYITHMGDGLFAALLMLFFLFIKFRYSLMQLIAFVMAGVGAQVLKRVVFPDVARPARYFENTYDLHFVEGVKIYKNFSFPSGHTATAFALFFCLIFTTQNRSLQFLYLLLAYLVGYSRIYLSLHFLPDIIAGSLIGILSAATSVLIFNHWKKNWMEGKIHFSRK